MVRAYNYTVIFTKRAIGTASNILKELFNLFSVHIAIVFCAKYCYYKHKNTTYVVSLIFKVSIIGLKCEIYSPNNYKSNLHKVKSNKIH